MATQITEQARSSLDSPVATGDEARDLNNQRASSLLDAFKQALLDAYFAGFQRSGEGFNGEYPGTVTEDRLKPDFEEWFSSYVDPDSEQPDFLPTSAASIVTSPKPDAGRGFFRT